ncbi:YD repeat-containing protein [Serratia sp. FS14]|uniref:RHS repeat-associated core domain-containing protein n=1 Tax=Serratia sp. (strain FS14) TaxID=1327989 RepID=UPI0004996692|nr:RHS repeat-associated core domain-containing protein [Serratia sp. FS14]AIA46957.1 YD repeat-containing protein [Serratia sp. FS14]
MQYDAAVDVHWHGNQQTDGKRSYEYDTLYRLTTASGRERLPDTAQGPLSGLQYDLSGGQGIWRRYTEQYDYDDGDNLVRVRHQGMAPWTREMTVLADSNRAVLKTAGPPSLSPDTLFTPGGCQRTLADGRELSWYADGQLAGVSSVVRSGREDDRERYQYAQAGERVRKVSSVLVSGGEQRTVVTYAGGMERRQRSTAGRAYTLDVSITESGGVRLIEDYAGGKHYVRYTLSDMLGSVMGETDEDGLVTAWEEYYPYGGSAGSDEEGSEVMDRTRRFSGKERDATGLYYYGHRYYQPGLCRWLSADPGGTIDGVNLYRMVRNNPLRLRDTDGLAPDAIEKDVINDGYRIVAKGVKHFPKEYKIKINNAVNIATSILSTALDAMGDEDNKVMEHSSKYFGNITSANKDEIYDKLSKIHDRLDELDERKYILIDGGGESKHVAAFVFPNDPEGRFFFMKTILSKSHI